MALFDRLKNMLRTEDKTNNKDLSLEHRKKGSRELDQSVYESPIAKTDIEKQKLIKKLTPRETDLYNLLLEGYTLKESAVELSVKYSTVNTHMTALYKKLEVNTRAELIIKYRGI